MLRILVLALMLGLWSGSAWAISFSPSVEAKPAPGSGGTDVGGGDYETGGNEGEGGGETDGVGNNVIRKQYTVQDATNAALDQGNTVSVTYK